MNVKPNSHETSFFSIIPIIDSDFDQFELKSEMGKHMREANLRKSEIANFYDDAFDLL